MNPSSSSMALIPYSSASSSSSKRKRDSNAYGDESDCKRPKNDVFMNYLSKDIGKSFISHLLASLRLNGFTISDYNNLRIGHDARFEVLKAIDESEISLVVFSPNYASSKECLDELVHIMDRHPDQRKVLPVFFNVDPSDVRNQEGHDFKEPFEAHKTRTDPETFKNWKQALKDVGQLSGLPLKNFRNEAKLVLEIVNQIREMLSPQDIHVTDLPVGIRSRSEELISKLRLYCEDVLVVGVFGLSGIGKTTIVKAMYNKIASKFEVSCFIEDIYRRYNGRGDWKFKLQKDLISQLNKDEKVKLHNDGIAKIQNFLRRKKTLLVLDDVDHFNLLEGLGIINPLRFYKGSRIIVTTRDVDSLGGISHTSYHTRLLNKRESRKLFIRLMFARDEPVRTKFVEEVVARAGGLPLVLKVWSRHFTQYKEHLPAALKTLKQIPHGDVQKQLQMSYDPLSAESKNLLLDIACFFNGMGKGFVIEVLNDEYFCVDYKIEELGRKFLVENKGYRVSLSHVIKEMSQEVVRQENPEEPGKRSRLVVNRDIFRVLRECSGTDSVRSIRLDYNSDEEIRREDTDDDFQWEDSDADSDQMEEGATAQLEALKKMSNRLEYNTDENIQWKDFDQIEEEATLQLETFKKMSNLRFIKLGIYGLKWSTSSNDDMSVCLSFKHLKYLHWDWFPCKSLDHIDMPNVVVIILSCSYDLKKLWKGANKSLKKLKILDVNQSVSLTKTGNFIGLENLEELNFEGCEFLQELDTSIGCLEKLVELNLCNCRWLTRIPWDMIGKLTSLQYLNLHGCSNIEKISNKVSQLHQLTKLDLTDCTYLMSIRDLPPSIEELYMSACINLVNLPSNISELQNLKTLILNGCVELRSEGFTQLTGLRNLEKLSMANCNVSQVSSRIENLVSLCKLDLSGNSFKSLPESFNNLSQLDSLHISNCSELQLLPPLPSQLTYIEAIECSSLDVMSFDSMQNAYIFPSNPFKESQLTSIKGLDIALSGKEVPEWCTYRKSGNVLSFVAPIQFHTKICGLIFCVTRENKDGYGSWVYPTIYNKTKETHHCLSEFGYEEASKIVMFYPLDNTTIVVEAGDTVELQFNDDDYGDIVDSGGLRLVYEDDVVDSGLVLKDVRKATKGNDDDHNDNDDDDHDIDLGLVLKDVRNPTLSCSHYHMRL